MHTHIFDLPNSALKEGPGTRFGKNGVQLPTRVKTVAWISKSQSMVQGILVNKEADRLFRTITKNLLCQPADVIVGSLL